MPFINRCLQQTYRTGSCPMRHGFRELNLQELAVWPRIPDNARLSIKGLANRILARPPLRLRTQEFHADPTASLSTNTLQTGQHVSRHRWQCNAERPET